MKKIGILGAAFNPIHIGHLIMAETALTRLKLDKIIFVPTKNPYHKDVELFPFDYRVKMVEYTIKDNSFFGVSDIESTFDENSYTLNLIKKLKEKENADYYFIMGADSILNFHTWYKYEELLKEVKFVVFSRPKYDVGNLILEYGKKTEIFYFDDLQLEISSTKIRKNLKEKISVRYLVHDRTMEYIKSEKNINYNQICEKLKMVLKESRYEHSLRVSETALKINRELNLGIDEKKVRLAATLHDCAKHHEHEYFLMFKEKYNLGFDILDQFFCAHSKLGAIVAKEIYGVDDEEILEAIRVHTLAKSNMSKLDKLLYLADYIEPERKFDAAYRVRNLISKGLNYAVLSVLNEEIEFHGRRNSVEKITLDARDYLLKEIENE